MANLLDCPECKQELQVPQELLGQLVKCPLCAKTFTSPTEVQEVVVRTEAPKKITPVKAIRETPPREVHGHKTGFRCPYCQSAEKPRMTEQISVAGWIVFAVMMVFCFPFFWIGLLMKDQIRTCRDCGRKLSGGVL